MGGERGGYLKGSNTLENCSGRKDMTVWNMKSPHHFTKCASGSFWRQPCICHTPEKIADAAVAVKVAVLANVCPSTPSMQCWHRKINSAVKFGLL